jgi:hypothetical protein
LFGKLLDLCGGGRWRRWGWWGLGSVVREERPIEHHADLDADPGVHQHVEAEQARECKLREMHIRLK